MLYFFKSNLKLSTSHAHKSTITKLLLSLSNLFIILSVSFNHSQYILLG